MGKIRTGNILQQLRMLFNSKYINTPIDAYIVYSNDAHMSEYTSIYDQRRKFISGFDGSAGTAIITKDNAYLWTDGRYYLAAESALDDNWTLMKDGLPSTPKIISWLKDLPSGFCVGTDPHYISYGEWREISKVLKKHNKKLVPVMENLVDIVWKENGKPALVSSTPYVYEVKYAGKTWKEKVACVREKMAKENVGVLVLSSLDEIAWLLNLRGYDIECCPVFKAFLLLSPKDIYLFIEEIQLVSNVRAHLELDSNHNSPVITIMPYSSVFLTLKELSKNVDLVWIHERVPAALALEIPKEKMFIEINPVTILKAAKNEVEINNFKITCARDGACLCEYFGKLKNIIKTTTIDECGGASLLRSIRSKMETYVMDSFETISSSGSNAAIIHYSPTSETAKVIDENNIYLCDSGAQYLDGTTDITRVMHFGTPTAYEKECYTLVLKGHIALSKIVFPKGVKGHRIDVMARQHLWSVGLDYLHGTGHGIGMFSLVHEGPQSIGLNVRDYTLEPGHVVSNEPGYYEDGKFGIRIENMMFVKEVETKYKFKNTPSYGFEMLSYVPLHISLIDKTILTPDEISWVNDYHSECVRLLKPEIEKYGFTDGLAYLSENAINL